MILRTLTVTPFEQNSRILADSESGEAMVIDPGGEVAAILSAIPLSAATKLPFRVTGVLLTHAHIDHAGGVAGILKDLEVSQKLRPQLYAQKNESEMRKSIARQAIMFGLSPAEYEACPEPDVFIDGGGSVPFGALRLEVLFTPGHSPGHVSFFIPDFAGTLDEMRRGGRAVESSTEHKGPVLLAGDALFAGSIGRTDLPGGNHALLLSSIREKLLPLPGETIVLSGHGPNTTIERERHSNPFLQ